MEPSRTLTWLEAREGQGFNEHLVELTERYSRKLRFSNDYIEIYRAQGALDVLQDILDLPDTIKEYLHDVSTGKRKRINLEEVEHGRMAAVNKR